MSSGLVSIATSLAPRSSSHSGGLRLLLFRRAPLHQVAPCPAAEDGWQEALAKQGVHVGLPDQHPLSDRIHKLFLSVHS